MATKDQDNSKGEVIDDLLIDDKPLTSTTKPSTENPTIDIISTKPEPTSSISDPGLTHDQKQEEPAIKQTLDPNAKINTNTTDSSTKDENEVPPPKPKRPLTPKQEAFKNLKDAFPTIEDKYITGVLIASGYNLESAFNALLYISDPDNINPEDLVPSNQRVTVSQYDEASSTSNRYNRRELTQLEQDELLARQLNDKYNRQGRRTTQRTKADAHQQQQQRRRTQDHNDLSSDSEDGMFTNFVKEDLPQMKEQFTKNIEETKNKVASWMSEWKRQYQSNSNSNTRGNQSNKKKVEFDDDPEEVDLQKFHGISLNDNSNNAKSKITSKTNESTKPSSLSKHSTFDTSENRPNLPNRNRAGSTDLYGTPKNSKRWESLKGSKPEPISKGASTTATTTTTTTAIGTTGAAGVTVGKTTNVNTTIDDDDFSLSDDDDFTKK